MAHFTDKKIEAENLSQYTQLGFQAIIKTQGSSLQIPASPQHTHICLHIDFARLQGLILPYNATGEKAQASSQVSIIISLNLGKRGLKAWV